MFRTRIFIAAALALCLTGLCAGAFAAEVDCDSTYCFTTQDFSQSEEPLCGICITGLPDPSTGTVLLGSRVLRTGDILSADQVAQMTFSPLLTQDDRDAQVTYLPIYENRVDKSATMTISIRGKTDKAPVAQDSALETYKNLPNEGTLQVSDPEGKTLTYTLTRQPKRGEVVLREDGSFLYTPKKNKVGVDSFTYTATDPAGNVSREATVTITILKPGDTAQYTDTVGSDCRFAAEWMKNTGLFVGEQLNGKLCFQADKPVSRGEFLAMLVEVLDIPMDENATYTGYTEEVPDWLKPYLAAALRSGLIANLPDAESGSFGASQTVTGGEAAVMLQNAMDLAVSTCTMEGVEDVAAEPTAEDLAVAAMAENGIALAAGETLTRGKAAQVLYQASQLAKDAPGLAMYQ